MNLREIKQRFWDYLGGDLSSSAQVADDALVVWANAAVMDLTTYTDCLQKNLKIECTTGVQEYDLPADCDVVWRAAYDDQKIKLTSKWDLQQVDNTWDRSTGLPVRYYVNGLNGKIGLYPIPSVDSLMSGSDVLGFGLDIFYRSFSVPMEDDEDIPSLPVWAHPYVVFYMLHSAYTMVGSQRRVASAAFWSRRYIEGRNRLRARCNMKSPKVWAVRGESDPMWLLGEPQMPEHITPPGGFGP